jgi:hypothetical protein
VKRDRRATRALLRSIPVLAALGVALAGCGGDARPGRYYSGYGGGYYGGGPGYYGSPYYGAYGPSRGYDRFYGSRGYYGGGGFGPRFSSPPTQSFRGPGVQEGLRQHWIEQSRRVQ